MQLGDSANLLAERQPPDDQSNKMKTGWILGTAGTATGVMDVGAVLDGMEANGVRQLCMFFKCRVPESRYRSKERPSSIAR